MTSLELSASGTDLTKEIAVRVTSDAAQPARPVATIDGAVFDAASPKENSIEVAKGSLLDLSCSTEGATIYYTTDDMCPCIEGDSRVEYTAPVPVTQNTRFRIAAYKEGMAFDPYSERLNFNVTVADSEEPSPDPEPVVDPGQKPGSDVSNPDGGAVQPGGSGAASGDTSEGGNSAADPGASGASGAEQEDDANAEATGAACPATGDSSGWAVAVLAAVLVAGAVLTAGAATCVFLKCRRERQR